jgi:hypothetical protein
MVKRYQRGNKKTKNKEEQTTQWSKETKKRKTTQWFKRYQRGN